MYRNIIYICLHLFSDCVSCVVLLTKHLCDVVNTLNVPSKEKLEMNHPKFEVVKLYYGDIYTGYCTKPDPDVELHPSADWTEEYAIKVVDGDVVSYFQLGSHHNSLMVTDVD